MPILEVLILSHSTLESLAWFYVIKKNTHTHTNATLNKCLFFFFLGSLPYEYKIVIAGNHELTFDQEFMADLIKQDFYYFPSVSKLKPESYENVQSLLTNCIYLQDSEVTVRGFRIYGSPW